MIIKRTEFILSVKLVCCINRKIAASQLPPLARIIRNKCIMIIIFMLHLFIGFVSLYDKFHKNFPVSANLLLNLMTFC